MSLLTWNHACSVDVRAMDDQHGILMDTTNELRQVLVRGGGREQVSEILDRLIEFTRMHFWSEEKLMEDTAFPGLAEHRAEHHRLLAEMMQSAHCLQYGETLQTRALLCTLRDGYLEHIASLDCLYGPWMNAKGIS
ncbi:MAG: bacteriohemerythrin [Terracidiphilus sp.]|nr:bacteriohemerythrin [Terracidiphilus sp.]